MLSCFFVERVEPRLLFVNVPGGFTDSLVGGGLESPVAMDFAPDGRIFVTEQTGAVRIVKDGQTLPTPFVELNVNSTGERGALGITFDPDFANNGFVYVYYTTATPSVHNRVSRFTASGDVAVPGSELVLLDLEPLGQTNHNGGAIHFGPDGKLYVAQGENGDAAQAQSLANRFGKILRINSDGSIPTDNPFFDTATGANRAIWAYGLRNPFTFAFHRTSGLMYVNDVGAATAEEINQGVAGANYGWPNQEGAPGDNPAFTPPVFFYGRQAEGNAKPGGNSIVGGAFYDAANKTFPADYADDYFFGDLSNFIWRYDPATGTASRFATDVSSPVDLKVGPDGSLYYVSHNAGQVRQIRFADGPTPTPTPAPTPTPTPTPTPPNQSPVATITSPREGRPFRGGQAIRFGGTGTDPEDGRLAKSALSWRVELHEGDGVETVAPERAGIRAGTFRADRDRLALASEEVFYRIVLTATDSDGATETVFRDVRPQTVTVTVNGAPPGAVVRANGQPLATPTTFEAITGTRRTFAADASQVVDGVNYTFSRWSQSRRAEFTFTVPARDRVVEAIYVQQPVNGQGA